MFLAVLLLIGWPVAELYVALKVADAIGVLDTILLLIASWPLGTWAVRSQGRVVWRRLMEAAGQGRQPGREVLDGVLVLIGGALMILPGFITDVLGALLLLPPTRALARRLLTRNLDRLVDVRGMRRRRSRAPYDVESTARDVEPPTLRP